MSEDHSKKSVVVCDTQPITAQGLRSLLATAGDLEFLASLNSLDAATQLLARKAPDIVILDEATAHLDSESEAAIQKAFEIALKGQTSIVIAHRLSTVLKADQILVVQDGRIVERGVHADLLASGHLYSELYHRQFSAA